MSNGELINFANISSDSAVPATTVKEYYSILEDTLMGFILKQDGIELIKWDHFFKKLWAGEII